jgi:hypothetical protein
MNNLTAADLTVIFNAVFFIILLAAAVLIIMRIRQRRRTLDQPIHSAQVTFPFPQRQVDNERKMLPTQPEEELDKGIREAYRDWLSIYLLPDAEPGRAFLRTGVARNWLRYQVTATSFGQALAMLVSVLVAGEDPQAQAHFDRILAFCLSHNSANAPDLMSWQVMPDVVPGRRLDADLNAEPWIAFALLAAQVQWGSSERFYYDILARLRLEALLPLYQQAAQNAPESLVVSPTFYQLFAHVTAEPAWKAIEDSLAAQGKAQWSSTHAIFTADNSPEEAKMGLSILQLGIAELEQAGKPTGKLTGEVEKRVRESVAQLARAELLDESELHIEPEGFSSLSLLACCTPAVLCLNDQALVDQQWRALTLAKPGRHDPIGATMRLLSLMQLSGNIWFDKVSWKELPPLPRE